MFIIFIWLNFQSLFVCALTTISAYNYFNEDEKSTPDNDETAGRPERRESGPQHLQDYDKEKPCQIKAEDCFVHRGFNRQYKEGDQNQSAMKFILSLDWINYHAGGWSLWRHNVLKFYE